MRVRQDTSDIRAEKYLSGWTGNHIIITHVSELYLTNSLLAGKLKHLTPHTYIELGQTKEP